ncbi:alpha-amylase [Streptomyces sp. NPDC051921]|uniref:alpha-amylase n=1 Tax=Streptomyces sp. NPDC051921 TaxID=3155806 RepID=UPI003437CD11
MTNVRFLSRASRPAAVAATAAAGLLALLPTAPSAGAVTTVPSAGSPSAETAVATSPSAVAVADSAPPECVQYYASWRYTSVVNGCGTTVAVTVEYTDGQDAPCRVIEPGASATFAGYGPQLNHITGLRTCDPGSTAASGA